MKNFILLIALFFNLGISAQNWNPISLNITYNYKTDTVQWITNTIFVDSINVNLNDTIFYLNRIMGECNTCPNQTYKLMNKPQFLLKQVTKKTDSLFIFQDTSEFNIKPLKSNGDFWTFDSINSINATITSVSLQNILGIMDSIKTISLSNGDTIILSKSFGIIQFPLDSNINYELMGIEKNDTLGESFPNFWGFFNYEVNDILQWHEYSHCGGGAHPWNSSYFKGIVASKTISGDTVLYQIQGKEINSNYNDFQGTITTTDTFDLTLTFIDSVFHLSNGYPKQSVSDGFLHTEVQIYKDAGIYNKLIDNINSGYYHHPADNDPNILRPAIGYPTATMTLFTEGLGQCIESKQYTCESTNCMQGRIHLGDTIGFIYPDSFYVIGVEEIINNYNLIIYPNPTSDQLSIISDKLIINKIDITDISGKLIKTIKENTSIISVVDLPNGIYFIKLITDEKTITKKFVKQ